MPFLRYQRRSKQGLQPAMKIFPHAPLHKLPLQILHVRVVSRAEIFFNRHGGGRRHASSRWHPRISMAKLHLGNVPNDLYESLRERARSDRRSISAEALSLIEQLLPTATKEIGRASCRERVEEGKG